MLEKILVATDFSVAARRAVMRAALLAKHKGAELTLLHVLPERTVKELLATVPGSSRITPIVLRGSAGATLLREIRERGPDLVIVGKRRSISDLDPHPFGSVSLRVALETPGDVLVVP